MYQIYITVFIISLFLGSFYNVVGLRTLSGEKLSYPASHCTSCNHRLYPWDLIPLFSWLFLKGKCRYCKEKISPIYPFGELLTAISYTLIIYTYGFTLEALIQIVFITIMIFSTVTDLKEHIVPDRFVIIGLILVFILRVINGEFIIKYLLSGIVSFGLLFLILIISKDKLGGADVKIYALIGLAIGFSSSICSLFYASFIGVIFNIAAMLISKNKKLLEIPFIPYITLGVLLTYIVNIYSFITF